MSASLTARMAALLAAQLTRRYHGERHLRTCSVGQWVGKWGTNAGGVGAPCSPACQAIHDVLAEYQRQPGLWDGAA